MSLLWPRPLPGGQKPCVYSSQRGYLFCRTRTQCLATSEDGAQDKCANTVRSSPSWLLVPCMWLQHFSTRKFFGPSITLHWRLRMFHVSSFERSERRGLLWLVLRARPSNKLYLSVGFDTPLVLSDLWDQYFTKNTQAVWPGLLDL